MDLPLISAIRNDDVALMKTLITSGHSVNQTNRGGNTPLHTAVLYSKLKAFEHLMTIDEVSINAKDHEGNTPLFLACVISRTPLTHIVRRLHERGAQCNTKNFMDESPLTVSVQRHIDPVVVNLLIQHGANIDDLDCSGESVFHLASCAGNEAIVSTLLYWGADHLLSNDTFEQAVSCESYDNVDLLFPLYFDSCSSYKLRLKTVVLLVWSRRDFVPDLISRGALRFRVDDEGLECLESKLLDFDPEWLQLSLGLLRKALLVLFDSDRPVLVDMILNMYDKGRALDNLSVLFSDSQLCFAIIDNTNNNQHDFETTAITATLKRAEGPNQVAEPIFFLLSYGVKLTCEDLVTIYERFGNCDLFQGLLHMDIVECQESSFWGLDGLVPRIYYKVNLCIELDMYLGPFLPDYQQVLGLDPRLEVETNLRNVRQLLGLFSHPRLSDFVSKNFEKEVDLVGVAKKRRGPSLLELSRNVAKEHIVSVFKVRNSRGYCTIVNNLHMAQVFKDILLFNKMIYSLE